jgi:hypothetical protein
MYAALPAGSFLVSLTSGWTSRVRRQGRAVVPAAGAWGPAVCTAGQLRDIWLVLLSLTPADACDMISGIFRSARWNRTSPDELRGRPGSSCCRTRRARSWARSGPAAWRR